MTSAAAPKRAGGRPARIARDQVVDAAIAVIDADGLEALTMRRLGAELEVAAMSLYRHLDGRDAVLAAVVARLTTTAATQAPAAAAWPQAVAGFARSYRETLLRHPNAVPLLATHPVDLHTGQELLAAMLDRFDADGIDAQRAATVVQSAAVFTLGHALAQVGTPPGTEPGATRTATERYYRDWFEAGLSAMLTGFASARD